MRRQIILTLIEGERNIEQGCPVALRITQSSTLGSDTVIQGRLPPAYKILQVFNNWQSTYRNYYEGQSTVRIIPKPGQVTNISYNKVKELGSQVESCLNEWLNSDLRDWKKIREGLMDNLDPTDEIQFFIQTQDIRMQQMPWHLWKFSKRYKNAEFILTAPQYQPQQKPNSNTKIRILAILGDSKNIDVEQDKDTIQKELTNADIVFLNQPDRLLLNDRLWDQEWDILFFAGHSTSQADGSTGEIQINQDDSLSLNDLKNALRKAVDKGLQLAIFNSCDGLGLAKELADLNISQIIVMRMPVPNFIAQIFLRDFLKAAKSKPLHLAVREAREKLQVLENKYHCASWLPVIYQNPNTQELIWRKPRQIYSLLTIALAILPLLFSSGLPFYSRDIISPYIEQSCSNFLIKEDTKSISLIAKCKMNNGSNNFKASINLNDYITNNQGKLEWKDNGNFRSSCNTGKLTLLDNKPIVLSYTCDNASGTSFSGELDLRSHIINLNGELKYVQPKI